MLLLLLLLLHLADDPSFAARRVVCFTTMAEVMTLARRSGSDGFERWAETGTNYFARRLADAEVNSVHFDAWNVYSAEAQGVRSAKVWDSGSRNLK